MKRIGLLLVLALLVASCGGDDGDSLGSEASDDVSQDFGTLDETDLSLVVVEVADGFGTLGTAQDQALTGVADAGAACSEHRGERADPRPSQVEIEIISIVDDCLQFSYDVADFRSFVQDLRMLRDAPDVIAASPLLLDYRFEEVEPQWPLAAIDADPVLDLSSTPTGEGIVVAVIDSGIDAENGDLAGVDIRRVPESGNGDYTETGHGTVAASIITAPIGTSSRGIAPNVTLLDVPADLCGPEACGCDPCASMTPAEAIRWSVDNGADIISMSFGYQPTPKPAWWQLLLDDDELLAAVETMEVALAYAELQQVAMVAAGGNCATGPNGRCAVEDQFEIPAGHQAVVGVGAVTFDDDGAALRAPYSTRQDYVEIVAPGNLVVTSNDGERFTKTGTSYATPFVTAALAILLGTDGPLAEQSNAAAAARDLLATTASDLAPEGRDPSSGFGQLQLGAVLDEARTFAAANPASE